MATFQRTEGWPADLDRLADEENERKGPSSPGGARIRNRDQRTRAEKKRAELDRRAAEMRRKYGRIWP